MKSLKFLFNKTKARINFFLKILKSLTIRHFHNHLKPRIKNLPENNFKKENLIVISIAFNNFEIIKQQYYYLKKYLNEKFCYIVADNSNLIDKSNLIYEYCILNNIHYVKIPLNPFQRDPSYSHGQAINWSYKNIIKRTQPTFFGFIDHDILPFRDTKITPYINGDGLFGPIRENKEGCWYLWAGFCFYEYEKVRKKKLNFLPHHKFNIFEVANYLDTGGSNYYKIYKNINKNNLLKIERIYFDFKTCKIINNQDNINTTIEIMGNWIHLMRTSGWDKKNNSKLYTYTIEEIMDITKKYFEEDNQG